MSNITFKVFTGAECRRFTWVRDVPEPGCPTVQWIRGRLATGLAKLSWKGNCAAR